MHRFWSKIWLDKNGKLVIWQTPNVWLISWAVLTFLSLFFTGTPAKFMSWAGEAVLLIWAVLEIIGGVNYFRRLLGLLVFVYTVSVIMANF
jgi:hypothetical protein